MKCSSAIAILVVASSGGPPSAVASPGPVLRTQSFTGDEDIAIASDSFLSEQSLDDSWRSRFCTPVCKSKLDKFCEKDGKCGSCVGGTCTGSFCSAPGGISRCGDTFCKNDCSCDKDEGKCVAPPACDELQEEHCPESVATEKCQAGSNYCSLCAKWVHKTNDDGKTSSACVERPFVCEVDKGPFFGDANGIPKVTRCDIAKSAPGPAPVSEDDKPTQKPTAQPNTDDKPAQEPTTQPKPEDDKPAPEPPAKSPTKSGSASLGDGIGSHLVRTMFAGAAILLIHTL